jgi:hypothetical protein
VSLTPEEMKPHRQLLAAFDEYIKLNLKWEVTGYATEGRKTRKALRKMMNIAYLRWQEVSITIKDPGKTDEEIKKELKQPGLAFIQSLSVAKRRESISEDDDNIST